MRKNLLISVFAICMLNVQAKSKDVASQILQMRDEVYMRLNSRQITTEQALKSYKNFQKQLLAQKDYDNYYNLFLLAAVDICVPNDDYENASKVIEEGLE